MFLSSGDALSLISSSERIALVIRSSKYLLGLRLKNKSSIAVSMPALLSRQVQIPRITRSTCAISKSSRMESVPPACARWREFWTFLSPPNDGAPNLAIKVCAASVWSNSDCASKYSFFGESVSAASCASGHAVKPASLSKIFGSSKASKCLFIKLPFQKAVKVLFIIPRETKKSNVPKG